MADKEFRVPFNEISNSQTITGINIRKFKEHGVDLKKNEVTELVDDHSLRQRIYKVRKRTYIDLGRGKK